MTFQSFSGEGTAFTAILSLQLKFCKIAAQGDCFLSKNPAVHVVGGSEPLLTLPQNLAFLSCSLDPAFQLDFMGEEGSQHPLLTPNPFPKCLGMEGGGAKGVGRGEWRPWGKGVLREGNQVKYAPGSRSRAGLGMSGLKTAGMCECVMPGV